MSLTPLMEQYQVIKREHPEEILFFRLGDFYEMFYEDARTGARVLGITLTSRYKDNKVVPMAGIPYHAAPNYINRFLKAGYKVAICEQLEEAEQAQGLVERGVIRVITPGTLIEDNMLDARSHNFLAALALPASPTPNLLRGGGSDNEAGLAWLDLSTGIFQVEEVPQPELLDELQRISPAEYLIPEYLATKSRDFMQRLRQHLASPATTFPDWAFDRTNAYKTLTTHFQTTNLAGFGCEDLNLGLSAAGAILEYLRETHPAHKDLCAGSPHDTGLKHITKIERFTKQDIVFLDRTTQRALELTQTIRDNDPSGSLLSVLDKTITGMGSRLLKEYLTAPLKNPEAINKRQDGVAYLLENVTRRKTIQQHLKKVGDLERIAARLGVGRANARDLVGLKTTLTTLPVLKSFLIPDPPPIIKDVFNYLTPLTELQDLVQRAIVDEPPLELKEGGIIREGYDTELDKIKSIAREGKNWIARFQSEEIKRTRIPSLKVGFNQVFGYYIEVTNVHRERVPSDYIRKQTLKNAERYITPQLKDYETQVLNAEARIKQMEYQLFLKVREEVAQYIPDLQKIARGIAILDVLATFAQVAQENNYIRPQLNNELEIRITEGRHPVLETAGALEEKFIPNDTFMDGEANRVLLITGPNMAGKSTYIRQVALLVLMAQMGSFIPAKEAEIGVVDRIFTRVGASDELIRGASTFMVEMNEAAHILNNATPRSLIVLDEIGRGTSTFDGLSIAWAVTEYIYDRIASRTLFATHYHELTELALVLPGVKNYHIAVKEWGDKVVFLRKIMPGGTDKSYGIQVARLAGLPQEVINRARIILTNLEAQTLDEKDKPRFAPREVSSKIPQADPFQLSIFGSASHPLIKQLKEMDLNNLTPLQALAKLQELKDMLEKE